jgi:3-hydroxyacyl-CoA dehydrogenase
MKAIRRVAVLGAGTMGARIAAHFANAGCEVLLLDLPGKAEAGLDAALRDKRPAMFHSSLKHRVRCGDFISHLPLMADCDWVLEAVSEDLAVKRALWERVLTHANPTAILSTNTSGLPLRQISEGWPDDATRRFLGTHFFNPPRYLHLLEIIPGARTDQHLLRDVASYAELHLGKGVVICKDTPNFIANRIGAMQSANAWRLMRELDLSIEAVDLLTGPLIGIPSTGTFRLADLVGLDIWVNVARNLYAATAEDPWRDRLMVPGFVEEMLQREWLGDKTGQGFYRRSGPGKTLEALDWKTLEYNPASAQPLPDEARESIQKASAMGDIGARLRFLVDQNNVAGQFVWRYLSDHITYCCECLPGITDRVTNIDRAMRWGYGHRLGPFEYVDLLSIDYVGQRMAREGRMPPQHLRVLRETGATSFYRTADLNGQPRTEYFDIGASRYRELDPPTGTLALQPIRRARAPLHQNDAASILDIGHGVVCLEFHSKMNVLGNESLAMLHKGLAELERGFDAMVIANEGEAFSAGANLAQVLHAAEQEQWTALSAAIERMQQAMMAIRYAPKPVVVAPHARALGGGCEMVLHARAVQAAAELYLGLVEVGVGVIPAAGGCKELLARLGDPKKAFELIGYARVSSSALDAKEMGLLDRSAGISMNADRRIADARTLALAMAPAWIAGQPRTDIVVGGRATKASLELNAWTAHQSGYISDYDLEIARVLAGVLSGGDLSSETTVNEQYLLDLEREAFLRLCGNPRTQIRMKSLLQTGRPIRN